MHTFAQKPKATQQTRSAESTIAGRGQFGQSPEVRSILHSQQPIVNQAVQRGLQADAGGPEAGLTGSASPRFGHDFSRIPTHPPEAGAIQTKLAITKLGDDSEQEADRTAEQVMRTPEPRPQRASPFSGGPPKFHTEQSGLESESLPLKRDQAVDMGQMASPPSVPEVLRSPGQPLDPGTRAFMEPRFGYDFSRVRVHTGAAAEESARDVNAQAYTVGRDVVFGEGRFAPEARAGRRLIAHELTHVVQQSRTGPRLARSPDPAAAAANLTEQQMAEIENKYATFKTIYTSDLTLTTDRALTDDEVAEIESRVKQLLIIQKAYFDKGQETDGSILGHLIGDLKGRLLMNKRLREMDNANELERWNNLSDSEKSLESWTKNHPEMRVPSNFMNDMTGSIMEESQSTDVGVFQALIVGALTDLAMSPTVEAPAPSPATPGPLLSRISAFTGTRGQFRDFVLAKLQSEPNNPLRFLLNASRTGFKRPSSRVHSELMDNPDVWEAGHINSAKLGGERLMIQSAWENQVQNITVEAPRVGGGVLDNPAVEVGGLPVAKSTVQLWEFAGYLPAGTAESAPVIQ
jgi:hypothetical protein